VPGSKIILEDSVFTNKEQGSFYSPNQTIYYFKDILDPQYTYRLNVSVDGKEGDMVSAETPIIEDFRLDGGSVFGNSLIKLGFVDGGGTYSEGLPFEWFSVPNGKAYQLVSTFHYEDHYNDSSVIARSFEIPYTVQKSFDADGGEDMEQLIKGEAFYQQIQTNVPPFTEIPNLSHRRFLHVTYDMIVGGDELNTYMEVNEPLTGILQDKPEYTNVNNGIGIFSTRVRVTLRDGAGLPILKTLNNNSFAELYEGQYTGSLGFCAVGGTFACQ
ncbi:MAG: hypothetical protein MRY83_06780, partial [Flavobacteriales bacterium]|nr:hypothetical protein [Flavobacteriales bacterium]